MTAAVKWVSYPRREEGANSSFRCLLGSYYDLPQDFRLENDEMLAM